MTSLQFHSDARSRVLATAAASDRPPGADQTPRSQARVGRPLPNPNREPSALSPSPVWRRFMASSAGRDWKRPNGWRFSVQSRLVLPGLLKAPGGHSGLSSRCRVRERYKLGTYSHPRDRTASQRPSVGIQRATVPYPGRPHQSAADRLSGAPAAWRSARGPLVLIANPFAKYRANTVWIGTFPVGQLHVDG